MKANAEISMVVSQGGAQAARAVVESLGSQIVTVTQKGTESLTALSQRVRKAVAYVETRQTDLTTAVFVARPGFDLEDVPGTADLVRGVVSHMVRARSGQVHFQAANNDPRSRYALQALADAVSDQVRGTGVYVVMRDAEVSQTFVLTELRRAATG